MYEILKHFHSGWAYLVLLLAILFALRVGFYAINKRERSKILTKLSLFTTIAFHVQLLAGVLLYFVGPYAKWGPDTMKVSEVRLYALEHPLMMFAAVIFITIANSKLKNANSEYVKLSTAVFALLALICVLSRIPWSTWLG